MFLLTGVACSSDTSEPKPQPSVPVTEPTLGLTVEEAGLVAGGELVRIYGPEEDPVPVEVEASRDSVDSQLVWRLEVVVEVGAEERRREEWIFWVGIRDDEAVVLRFTGPGAVPQP